MVDDMIESSLRDLGVDGFIRFSIKAHNTEENMAVHNAFREFCKVETDNNYTLGIKKLLENYSQDTKFDILYEMIQELEMKVDDKKSKEKENEENAF
jgi:hypothetical protein